MTIQGKNSSGSDERRHGEAAQDKIVQEISSVNWGMNVIKLIFTQIHFYSLLQLGVHPSRSLCSGKVPLVPLRVYRS